MPSLIFRPRYSTIAGCQSECDLRNSSIRLPANRYFARAVLNRCFMLQLFALLRGQIGFQKNFAWIVLLSHKSARSYAEKKDGEQSRTGSLHAMARRIMIKPAGADFRSTGAEQLLESRGKSSPLFAKEIRILKSCSVP